MEKAFMHVQTGKTGITTPMKHGQFKVGGGFKSKAHHIKGIKGDKGSIKGHFGKKHSGRKSR